MTVSGLTTIKAVFHLDNDKMIYP